MGKKQRRSRPGARTAALRREARPRDLRAGIAAGALALALFAAGMAVDSGADASFDAPKRLTSLFLIGLAASTLAFSRWRSPLAQERLLSARSLALFCAAGALVWAALSALLSPHRPAALDATRSLFLYALLLPIGASRALEGGRRFLVTVFLAVAAVNAAVSILQATGQYQPFALQTEFGSRESTGAYVGNVGYLAVALALAGVAALGLLFLARRFSLRAAAAVGAALFAGALIVNRNLTSLSALLAGVAILSLALWGWRALLPAAAIAVVLSAGVAAYHPMRKRVAETVQAARAGDWNRLVTYRVGAWRAAMAMARERPIFGYGPGTFGAEFTAHRLAVEIADRRRYDNPLRTSSYGEAHCDYLQPFAEAGVPAGLAALGAVVSLFAAIMQALHRTEGEERRELVFLLALLGAGAAAALTWFPMQRPISAIPLLLASGRAWRISDSSAAGRIS